jgi:hypothetical protein
VTAFYGIGVFSDGIDNISILTVSGNGTKGEFKVQYLNAYRSKNRRQDEHRRK